MKTNQSRREFLRLSALSAGFEFTQPLNALSIHDVSQKNKKNTAND